MSMLLLPTIMTVTLVIVVVTQTAMCDNNDDDEGGGNDDKHTRDDGDTDAEVDGGVDVNKNTCVVTHVDEKNYKISTMI